MFGLARERSRPPVACRQRSPRLPTSETTMMSVSHASTRAALALVLASVSWSARAAAQGPRSALDPITSAVINHPITTSSAEARAHFLEGLREFDLGRLIDANVRSEEHTSELQSLAYLVCRLLLEKKTAPCSRSSRSRMVWTPSR